MSGKVLYSVGHSNHSWDTFLSLLKQHQIEILADVRTQPFSRYTPHFNKEMLQPELQQAGIGYLFMGDQLGGRPEGSEYYDPDGHVLYYRVAESSFFREGIERLKNGIENYRVAIMCSEEDPTVCHRFLLVTRVLAQQNIEIQHIRGDGSLQDEAEVCHLSRDNRQQGMLFAEMENDTWKSLRSVLHKVAPNDSLDE